MYRYRITPLSPFATPMRSDTLYGHLLCTVREWDGDKAADELISAFESGCPPFRLSSVFPQNMLPMPVLPPARREEVRKSSENLLATLKDLKKFRKLPWIPTAAWIENASSLSQHALYAYWLTNKDEFAADCFRKQCFVPHNSISRVSGTVLDQGGLYFDQDDFYGKDTTLDLYVDTERIDYVDDLLNRLSMTGFGKNKTTGKGQFSVCRDMGFQSEMFEIQGDHFLNLSVYSAPDLKGITGSYNLFTKYGKVWNGFGQTNPYKKPFMAFSEGSVFTSSLPETSVLRGIHADQRIVQILCPLVMPCRFGGEYD